jgi:triphosphoribosyl-dephospho-CoA synthase
VSAAVLPTRPAAAAASPAAIADLAAHCLRLEVRTSPKPGLVSHVDSGSHADMDADTFRRSTEAIRPHLRAMADAGGRGCPMSDLRAIGLDAEAAMLATTGGVNTHRGAIFGLGLLCAAAGARAARTTTASSTVSSTLGGLVARLWGGEILSRALPPLSHGQQACLRYGVGGASLEAARGFPMLYDVGLPALREGAALAPGDSEAARIHCCFALIAALDDTNLLHRGGVSGLLLAQEAARGFLEAGGVGGPHWREHALDVHRVFVDRRLSPGGAADLLAMSLFVDELEPSGAR